MKYILSIRNAIEKLITEKNAYVIGEDIREPYGGAFKVTKGLSDKFPKNIIGTPMSEQGFTALGVGMAFMGDYVIEEIMFGDFITLAADQLINHAAKFYDLYGQKMHFVIRVPSGGYRGYGATHSQSLEKLFCDIPGINVVASSIYSDVGKLLIDTMEDGVPSLFVENKLDYSKELVLDDFDIFERTEVKNNIRIAVKNETPSVTIVTYGGISSMAVDAAKKAMYEEEIPTDIVVAQKISGNIEESVKSLIRTDNVIVIDESTGKYGFTAQVASGICNDKKIIRLNSSAYTIPSAKRAEQEVLLQTDDIYAAILSQA